MKYFWRLSALGIIFMILSPRPFSADEAFVVLEYNSAANSRDSNSERYLVKPGDTLGRIVDQHYGYTPNQQELFRQIIVQNPHAFVEGNPNKLLSGMKLNLPGALSVSGNSSDEIYFF